MTMIKKDDGKPFTSVQGAQSKQQRLQQNGIDTEILKINNKEFVLKRLPPENAKKEKPKRVPIGKRDILTAPQAPGKVRRFVNDVEDRIDMFEAAGYTLVRGDIPIGDPRVGEDTQIGSVVSKSVGGGKKAFLMEIDQELYEQDQAAKQAKIKEAEADMQRRPSDALAVGSDGTYGKVKIGRGATQ